MYAAQSSTASDDDLLRITHTGSVSEHNSTLAAAEEYNQGQQLNTTT